MDHLSRRRLALGGAALAGLGVAGPVLAAAAPEPPAATPPPTTTAEAIASQTDAADRMTVKVRVNGQGPYPFVVDTGAERSTLAGDLAAMLMLPPGPPIIVHGVAGEIAAPSALVGELAVGGRRLRDVQLPLLQRTDIGAAGVLGIDVLQGQRVELDFLHREMRVQSSAPDRSRGDEIVVSARSRYGQLILVDSMFMHEPIVVVVDTGAQNSIGNNALRRLVQAGRAQQGGSRIAEIYSVTGQTTTGEWALISNVQVGGFGVNNLPVIFSELHSFDRWKLGGQPALLLGMDVLRQFDRVDIDFARREVRFRGANGFNDQRFAARPGARLG
jgi:predicted aspartyl protease